MRAVFDDLRGKQKELEKELEKITKAINALKDLCKHTLEDGKDAYEYKGHDSHYDYNECTICGNTTKV